MTYCEEIKFNKTIKNGLYIIDGKEINYRILQNKEGIQKFMYSIKDNQWITISIGESLNDKLFMMFEKLRKQIKTS